MLHLGNISFAPTAGGEGSAVDSQSQQLCALAAHYLQVDAAALGAALVERQVAIRGEVQHMRNTVEKACEAAEALAKARGFACSNTHTHIHGLCVPFKATYSNLLLTAYCLPFTLYQGYLLEPLRRPRAAHQRGRRRRARRLDRRPRYLRLRDLRGQLLTTYYGTAAVHQLLTTYYYYYLLRRITTYYSLWLY